MMGCISYYEENLVRVEVGYKLREWERLDPMTKAIEICAFRIKRIIEGTIVDKRERDMEAKSRSRR